MRQFKDILRGCIATYFVGVFLFLATEVPSILMGRAIFDMWSTLVLFAVYGAALAIPTTLIILVIWGALAARDTIVQFLAAPCVAALIFGALAVAMADINGLVFGVFSGALAGLHFWYWAFGRAWKVRMHFE